MVTYQMDTVPNVFRLLAVIILALQFSLITGHSWPFHEGVREISGRIERDGGMDVPANCSSDWYKKGFYS